MKSFIFAVFLGAVAVAQSGTAETKAGSISQTSAAGHNANAQANTIIAAELNRSIDSKRAKVGDEVTAKVLSDARTSEGILIPKGSKLIGKVTEASARLKGDANSTLGVAFERALLKNGTSLAVNSTIQAIVAPVQAPPPAPPSTDTGGSSGRSSSADSYGGTGGGGLGDTVGGVAGTATNAAGGIASTVDHSAAGGLGAAASPSAPVLTTQTTGVIGIKGLELNASADSSTSGSVFSGSGKNVKLESGSRLLVRVNSAQKEQPPGSRQKESN